MRRIATFLLVLFSACGDSAGQLGDPCTDGTCGTGLACINDICVAELCSEGAADDCCPDNATTLTDPDCAPACGNAVLEAGELCDTAISAGDGACPTTCESAVGCTITALVDDGTCQAACTTTDITTAANGDACCPSGANANNDNDCTPVCGNSVEEVNETCDDGNTALNDGCSDICLDAPLSLDVAVLQPTINTELATTHQIDVTLTATNGFMGAVTLAATVVDANQQAIPGWTAVLDDATHDLAQNGTTTTFVTLTIPSRNTGLAGTVKVTATSAADAGTFTADTTVTVANQITITVPIENGLCVLPPAGTTEVTVGTNVRWFNPQTNITNWVIHTSSSAAGIPHQQDPGTAPGGFYEGVITGNVGTPFNWSCHSPGPTPNDILILPVAP